MKNTHRAIPLDTLLKQGESLLLLTPVVAPEELLSGAAATAAAAAVLSSGRDPYEDLGRALAAAAAAANKRSGGVKHVPYTARGGITSTHADFIRRAGAIVFVVSGPSRLGQPDQLELARAARRLCCCGGDDDDNNDKPLVVVLADREDDFSQAAAAEDFSTVIRIAELSPSNVASLAALMLDRSS